MVKEYGKREYAPLIASLIVISATGALFWYGFLPVLWLETHCDDLRSRLGRKAEISNQIIFCGITNPSSLHFDESELKDNPDLRLLVDSYPWSREVWGSLLTKLFNVKVNFVVFDLIFDTERKGDAAFKSVLDNHKGQVIMGCFPNPMIRGPQAISNWLTPHESILGDDWNYDPTDMDGPVGHTYVPIDWDGRIRNFQNAFYSEWERPTVQSLMAKAILKTADPEIFLKCNRLQRFRFAGGPGTYPVIPLQEILTSALWKTKFDNGRFFEDKIVVIGATGNWSGDQKRTPFPGLMDGTEVQINILNAMMQGELLSEPRRTSVLFMIVVAGLFGILIAVTIQKPVLFWSALLVGSISYVGAAVYVYNSSDLLLPIVSPPLAFGLTAIVNRFFVCQRPALRWLRNWSAGRPVFSGNHS